MTSSKLRTISRSAMTLALLSPLAGCAIAAQEPPGSQGQTLSSKCPPAVPVDLAVQDGNRLAFLLDAVGQQIYACKAVPAGFAWVFQAPTADLLNPGGQLAGTHFAGPTWQANDGSKVVGARVAGLTVDKTAIPWLLLRAVSNEGDGRMAKITFIQRLDTAGGLAPPAETCTAANIDEVKGVDYVATYFFYEPQQGNPQGPSCD